MKKYKYLIIGDIHENSNRQKAIKSAEDSIINKIKDKKFERIIFLGDLFDKKPTASERIRLAQFIKKLRKYCTGTIDFIIGNGRHTFEDGSIHEQDWMELCEDFTQQDELMCHNFRFGHYEVKGTKYINGYESESKIEIDNNYTYLLGHIHSPSCSFNNVNYVGSIYKVSFSEINDTKRVAIIDTENNLEFLEIESRPMYEIELIASSGKVKIKGLKNIKEKDIDLKIKVHTDIMSLGEVNRALYKIKKKFNIEYYKEEIKIKEQKVDIPEDLNQNELLKKYCKDKKVDFNLIQKEIVK